MDQKWMLLVFLALCAAWDLHSGKIPLWLPLAEILTGALSAAAGFSAEQREIGDFLWGMVPGGLICAVSWLLKGQIGTGDGWILMAVGAVRGWKESAALLGSSLIMIFPVAFFWSVIRKKREKKLPFAPFIMGGYIWRMLCGGF